MKIKFLGTSHGVPAKDRFCSSVMIEANGAVYLIDAGAPLLDLLVRNGVDLKDLRAVFTTHTHGDHTVGLISLTTEINWYFKDCEADFFVTEQSLIDAIENLITVMDRNAIDRDRIRYFVAREGVVLEDENVRVEYIPTAHMPNSYAILVSEKGTEDGEIRAKALFSGDLSGGLRGDDVPREIENAPDVFVCELAHFGIEHLAPYLERCSARRVVFTHVFPYEKFDDIRRIEGKYPFDVIIAEDGDVIEI